MPGDAFLGMARSLSLSASRLCVDRGLPATQEALLWLQKALESCQERLDLALCMLESDLFTSPSVENEVCDSLWST